MTQIDFYTHVEDKLKTVGQIVQKALERELKVVILTPDAATTEALDRMLWTQPAIGFIPHCRADHPLRAQTPVIVDHAATAPPHDDVLINLCATQPELFSRFQRVVEIVSTEEADRSAARERFRFYRERGYDIRTHDLSRSNG